MRWKMAVLGGLGILGLVVGLHAGAVPQKVKVEAKEFSYSPNRITVKSGQPVELLMENKGVIEHDLVVEKLGVKIQPIQPGKTAELTFTPKAKGRYPIVCSVPGHKEAGMTGTLVVE
jgi:uncharacterized cupredoxin-like copper-binding protein